MRRAGAQAKSGANSRFKLPERAEGSAFMSSSPPRFAPLSLLETRVLGVLVEKEHTVPDTYPLSVNALTAGCNQKNNRSPVIEASDAEVQAVLDALRARTLVIETSGARVTRYAHNVGRVLRIPDQSLALLAVLMLRGPQTAAELRTATERMHRFADVSSVEAFLDELSARAPDAGGPLVVKLPRAPGEREARWAHLLSGPVELRAPAAAGRAPAGTEPPDLTLADAAALRANQALLAAEIAELRGKIERLAAELGIAL
jgi:uncharacterized protein YceH (UPF0502 family)